MVDFYKPNGNMPLVSGTITTQNLVPAGEATAGSAVEAFMYGNDALCIQVTGTYTGALSLQVTLNGTTWVTVGGTPLLNLATAGYLATVTSALQGVFKADGAGFLKARLAALAAVTGTATVTMRVIQGANSIGQSLPTGTNSIGNIGTVTTVTTCSTLTTLANGQTAHSSASTGSPVRIGGRVKTANDTTLVAGDASDAAMTTDGAQVIKPFAAPELDWFYAAAASGIVNTTTAVVAKAAAAAGVRNYVTGVELSWDSLTNATEFAIRDGAAGSIIWRHKIPANSAGSIAISFATPRRGTAATGIEILTTAASGTGGVYANLAGYAAP